MNNNNGGYQSDPVVAGLYDQVIPYRDRPDIEFFVQAALEAKGPVLEVGCGTGRVLIPTARAGATITGLDISSYMLDVCRQSLKEEPQEIQEQVTLVEGDMRNFDLGKTFSLVTTPFRPFQHLLTTEDQISCLECIYRHLEPGGILILDNFNPSLVHLTRENLGEEREMEPEFTTPDGTRVLRKDRIVARDYIRQIQDVELIYYLTHPDGKKERLVHAFPMRYLFRYEAEHLLVRSGYEVMEIYGDYHKNPFGKSYPGELIFIARKPAS
jgi:SAM-dependent methyltransferase